MTGVAGSERVTKTFEALLAPILDASYGTAYRITGNREAAEDLVQETALQAFSAFHTFEEGTNFRAWFLKILINRFRQDYRRRKREPVIVDLDDAPDLYLYQQTAASGLQARCDDPAALVIGKMSEESIQAAIAALPEEFQVVSVLYFMGEMQYQEIADILDCPVGTVRSRLHRGRKMLQKALWHIAEEHGVIDDLTAGGEAP